MKIDLHIHSKDCSDGKMTLPQIFKEAHKRYIQMISITDHDNISCQASAITLAEEYGMDYIPGVELNIKFSHPEYGDGKQYSLDMLGYAFDIEDTALNKKLEAIREFRRKRAEQILEKLNVELTQNRFKPFTHDDLKAIEETVDGSFGRPHIANYMIKKGIVKDKQTAFDRYLVKCNVPKMPVSLEEASDLIRRAGGKLIFAHPNNPHGTSLGVMTRSLEKQFQIIADRMIPYLDGIECWHSAHDNETSAAYLNFARKHNLMVTGGSDCHQQPVIIGSVKVPSYVAEQFWHGKKSEFQNL